MKVKKLVANGVHGFLNFNIDFNDQLTFLIGINGSGKTTALKLMLGFLGPSFDYINQVIFSDLTLTCTSADNKFEIAITAKRNENNTISVSLSQSNENPINDDFEIIPNYELFYDLPREERTRKYEILLDKFNDLEVVKEIKKLTTPIFLGLDRRLFKLPMDMHYETISYRRFHSKQYYTLDPINRSLEEVQSLVFNYYRSIVPQQSKFSQSFKNDIFMKFFDFIDEKEISIRPEEVKKLKEKKEKINSAVNNLNIEGVNHKVNIFFNKIEDIYKKLFETFDKKGKSQKDADIQLLQTLFINSAQLKRFDEIVSLSQQYQNNLNSLIEPLDRLKNIVYQFFSESKKELIIEENGILKIKLFNGELANIFELSSGEKQILIMIAHLIFCEDQIKKSPGIFIVDEPELSLHMAWQQIFVDSILEASPNTQFIMATHSPAIIADESREKFCYDLSKQ